MRPSLFIASDHGGFVLKKDLLPWLQSYAQPTSVMDLGTDSLDSVDYPDIADLMARSIKEQLPEKAMGILLCGSGVGVSIAANRYPFMRAALVSEPVTAALSRAHNNANILCLGARLIGTDMAKECIKAFLSTPFDGGRHERRVEKLCVLPSY